MSLREWDRKAKIVKVELGTLIENYDWKDIDRTEQVILAMHAQLPKVENSLARNLAFIVSQATRKGLFTVQEKAILHWASDYSKRVQSFFKDYSEAFNEVFWAKIVVSRTSSVTSHGEGEFFTNHRGQRRMSGPGHQRQLLSARRELKKRRDALAQRNIQLEERYQRLAMIKANRDAVNNVKIDKDYLKVLPKKFSGLKPGSVNEGSRFPVKSLDLSGLSTRPHMSRANEGNSKRSKSVASNRQPVNPIEAFDYLNLEQQLGNIEH